MTSDASASVECVGSCEADCRAECEVDPGEFNCLLACQGDCSGGCEGRCSAEANRAECKASCEATCSGECDARCKVQPPDVDCDAKCQAACTGSCDARANIDCQIEYKALATAEGTKVDAGACPETGDISLKVSTDDGKATYEWIAYNQLQKPGEDRPPSSFIDLLIGAARADVAGPRSEMRLAQSLEVVCQALVSKTQLVRVVRALSPHIGARAELEGRSVTVWRAQVAGDGSFEPLEVQPDGGRRMPADAWRRGLR